MPTTPKYLSKDHPARKRRDFSIIQSYLSGQSQKAIAKIYHVTDRTVSEILSDEQAKKIIDTSYRDMVKLVPLAINNYVEFLQSDKDQVRYKASNDLLKMIGVMPSHAQSVFIQNLNVQNNLVADPEVLALLSKATTAPVDVEFTRFEGVDQAGE